MTSQTITKTTFVFVLEIFILHKHFVLQAYVKDMLLNFCLVFCLDKVHFHILTFLNKKMLAFFFSLIRYLVI